MSVQVAFPAGGGGTDQRMLVDSGKGVERANEKSKKNTYRRIAQSRQGEQGDWRGGVKH
jgi:hypothetical protein